MKKVSDYQGLIENDTDVIRRVLLEWKPTRFDMDEKGQEREQFAWLKQRLPGVAMKSQYGIAWGAADIVIEDTHVIELKLGFAPQGVGEFDRCVGQLWRYKEKWIEPKDNGRVWLITVGESEAEFQHLLKKPLENLTIISCFHHSSGSKNYPRRNSPHHAL